MNDDFLYRHVPALGRRVFRVGLATNYGIDGEDLAWALDQGVNYVFWPPNARRVTKSLNAAHPGAEQDIFPLLAKRRPAVVAYTATRWRGLLKRPKGWTGPVMTAVDCYRFCLSNPHVDLVLTGPKNRGQLQENLDDLREKGPLSEEETRWIRNFGEVVHQASSRFTFRF